MFKNAVETLNYFAEQCNAFKPIRDEYINLKKDNEKLNETNESTVQEIVNTKLENMTLKEQNEMLVKELADTKLMMMDIQSKLHGGA